LFADPTHPNDLGNERMAKRLAPIIEKIALGRAQGVPGTARSGSKAVPVRVP
jgi:hypothetical protein